MLKVIYGAFFMDGLCSALLLPLIGRHILSLGGSYFLIGLVGSLSAAVQLLSGPIVGSWSDAKGRKIPLLYLLLFGSLCNALTAITFSIPTFIVLRCFNVLFAKSPILLKAVVADNVDTNEHANVYAKMGAISAISFIIGPIIGGHLFEYANGFQYISYIMCVLTLTSMGLVMLLPQDNFPTSKAEKPQTTPATNVASFLFDGFITTVSKLKEVNWPAFSDLFIFKFLTETTFALFYSSFGMVLQEKFMVPHKQIGYTIAFQAFAAICFSLMQSKVRKSFYSKDLLGRSQIIHGFIGLTLTIFAASVTSSYWMYITLLVPQVIARILLETAWTEVLLSRAAESEKGSVLGASESLIALAGLVTPLASGTIAELYGNNVVHMLAAAPVLIGTVLFSKLTNNKKNE